MLLSNWLICRYQNEFRYWNGQDFRVFRSVLMPQSCKSFYKYKYGLTVSVLKTGLVLNMCLHHKGRGETKIDKPVLLSQVQWYMTNIFFVTFFCNVNYNLKSFCSFTQSGSLFLLHATIWHILSAQSLSAHKTTCQYL